MIIMGAAFNWGSAHWLIKLGISHSFKPLRLTYTVRLLHTIVRSDIDDLTTQSYVFRKNCNIHEVTN